MNRIVIIIFSLGLSVSVASQVPSLLNTQRKAQSELARRGITETELAAKLAEKGIYLDNTQNLTVDEAIRLQANIEQAILEIEAEKNKAIKDQFAANDTTVRPSNPKRPQTVISQDDPATKPGDELIDPIFYKIGKDKVDTVFLPVAHTSNTASNLRSQPIDTFNVVYGQEIFKNKSVQLYNKSENIKPPESYILGVGDVMNIHIFGRSKADHKNLEISPQGYVQVGQFPRIYVKGLTFAQAKKVISQNLASYYVFDQNEFELTIDFSREIGVNIWGEAEQIGTFNIPATNTAVNALVAAKGPNKIGSIRNIKLIRGKTVKRLDIYEFINNPTISQDFYLEQNDIIHIPIAEKVVTILGAVRRPMKYELIEGEDLMKLIQYAAGLREDAYQKMIQVKRYIDDEEKIIDVPFKELVNTKGDFKLISGDLVSIKTIPLPVEQVVSIIGRVVTPGTYQYVPGMRISDLLEKGQVNRGAKTDLTFLQRLNDDGTVSMQRINVSKVLSDPLDSNNITLRRQDRLMIYSLSMYVDQEYITAGGAIRKTVRVAFDPQKSYRVSDMILLGGGLLKDAMEFGYIKRINKDNFVEKEYLIFNSSKAISNPGSSEDPILEPGDDILLYSDRSFFDEAFVTISGSVRKPGTFPYGPGISLKDLVVLSGGFTREAATNRIEVFRVLLDENRPTRTTVATLTLRRGDVVTDTKEGSFKLMPFDQIQVRTVPDFEMQQNVTVSGEVLYPGTYALINQNETIVDLLKRAGGPSAEAFLEGATLKRSKDGIGFIVFRMPEAVKNPRSWDNLILKEGDTLSIPKVVDFVRVEGAISAKELYQDKLIGADNRINVAFVPNKSAKYYVDEFAAGVAKDGAKRKITVEQPNGRITKTKNFLFFKSYPKVHKGSIVKVGVRDAPRSNKKGGTEVVNDTNGVAREIPKRKVDWSRVLADAMAQATSVLTFILLIQNLKKQP